MSKDNLSPQTPGIGKPEELSTGKQMLVKGWRSLTTLCSRDGVPPTGEAMGKKMLWGIGGLMLGHFSGMGWIGSIISGLTGLVFNDDIKGMGNSLTDLFKGKISITDKKVLSPLLGGLAGFGLSVFGLKAGFLSSLMFGITGAAITDRVTNGPNERQASQQPTTGLPQEKENKDKDLNKSSKESVQLKRKPGQAVELNHRQTTPLPVQTPSDQKLLAAVRNTPNGLEKIRSRFPDTNTYNDFISRNGLKTAKSKEIFNRFQGLPPMASASSNTEVPGRNNIQDAEKPNFKIGLS